jgi:hypothetical protein
MVAVTGQALEKSQGIEVKEDKAMGDGTVPVRF